MPRIPTAREQVGLNSFRVPTLSAPNIPTVTSLDRATEKLAGGLDKVQDYLAQKQEQEDVQNLLEAESAYKLAVVEKTREFGQRKGKDAAGSLNDYDVFHEGLTFEEKNFETFNKLPQSVTDFKTKYFALNGNVRQKMDNLMAAHLPTTLSAIGKYEDQQTLLANQDIFETAIESAIAMASINPNDQVTVNQQKQRINASAEGMGKLMGSNREAIDLTRQKNISALHNRVFNAHLESENPEAAREYLKVNRKEFHGSAGTKADAALKPVLTKHRALAKTREVMLLPPEKQDAAVFAINDPEVQEQTRTYVEQRQASIANAQKADMAQADKQITDALTKGAPLEAIPQELWQQVSAEKQRALVKYSVSLNKEIEAKTDPQAVSELWRMPKKQLIETNIAVDFVDRLSGSDMNTWLKRQAEAVKDSGNFVQTQKEILAPYINMIQGPEFDNPRIEGAMNQAVLSGVDAFQQENARQPNDKEYLEIVKETATIGFVVNLRDKFKKEIVPAGDTFTVTQQLNTAFEANELTGVDNSQKRGLIKTRVENIIRDRETQTSRRMRDDERASIIQGVVEDKIQVPGFLFGSNEKLVVEATDEEILKGHVIVETDEGEHKVTMQDIENTPDDVYKAALREIKQAGEPATKANVAKVLVQKHKAVAVKAKAAAERAENEFLKANSNEEFTDKSGVSVTANFIRKIIKKGGPPSAILEEFEGEELKRVRKFIEKIQ